MVNPVDPALARAARAAAEARKARAARLRAMGLLKDPRLLAAFESVPRHLFVPKALESEAYGDRALPIGEGQTITQPANVARSVELLDLKPGAKVLEIGTGSGYQAAVLSRLVAEVYTVELLPDLARDSEQRLLSLGYANVHVRVGDGWLGWPEHAPYDAVMVTCAADSVPPPLEEQLAEGGRMAIPVGPPGGPQTLLRLEKRQGRIERETVIGVMFVPLRRLAPPQ